MFLYRKEKVGRMIDYIILDSNTGLFYGVSNPDEWIEEHWNRIKNYFNGFAQDNRLSADDIHSGPLSLRDVGIFISLSNPLMMGGQNVDSASSSFEFDLTARDETTIVNMKRFGI
jgi:hypothetical protein